MAILFGVLAIILGIVSPWVGGWVGFCIAAVFGVLAIVVTILKNKKNAEAELPKKKAGMVCGIVGLALALLNIAIVSGAAGLIKKQIDKYGGEATFPAMYKTVDKLSSTGVVGMLSEAKSLGFSDTTLTDELKLLSDYQSGKVQNTEAPSETQDTEAASEEGQENTDQATEAGTEAAVDTPVDEQVGGDETQ